MDDETSYLALAGIQHFAFCRRQWALIHIEQQWQENLRTVQGELFHTNVHSGKAESRGDVYIARGLSLVSHSLRIQGVSDAVEFHRDAGGVPIRGREGLYLPVPIEYKRGAPKSHDADALQLCAQAICLEEMLVCQIDAGALFYGETKRRQVVSFDADLRARVREMVAEMYQLYDRGYTPQVRTSKQCNACSLRGLCLPVLARKQSAKAYLKAHWEEDG
ncbi:MAG: CRISPR-associated protein Cas4 [Oscillospiraceae bacterium]|nr:CRISPR-associated protein Cas4 [Oscillospiraceae bacterium]